MIGKGWWLPVALWLRFTVEESEHGMRLASALRSRGASRGLLRRLKRHGEVTVNGWPVRLDHVLHKGERVEVRGRAGHKAVAGEDLPLEVVYRDEHLLVVNKPAGMLVHPAHEKTGTLANAVVAWLAARGAEAVPRPVNRLDRGTSGLVVFALSPVVAHRLCLSRERGEMRREYLALVNGVPARAEGEIAAPVGGKPAVTRYRVLRRWENASLLLVTPRTGRLHQIRVHLAGLGHPLLGDTRYGTGTGTGAVRAERPALHAWRLSFPHPVDGRPLCLRAAIPDDFRSLMGRLGPPPESGQPAPHP
ncbi:MAG: RluA family pseudouridine synthase [Firmicutes bacterium]|nr:RluA family pseudouridine synthase [Bacillota bacterium]